MSEQVKKVQKVRETEGGTVTYWEEVQEAVKPKKKRKKKKSFGSEEEEEVE